MLVSSDILSLSLSHTHTHTAYAHTMATPFRFRDLPAEMRNRIIAFAVLEPEPIEIYNVSPPAITAVSRELRRESMAVFFLGEHIPGAGVFGHRVRFLLERGRP
jgi:hypothetical protein